MDFITAAIAFIAIIVAIYFFARSRESKPTPNMGSGAAGSVGPDNGPERSTRQTNEV